MATEIAKAKTAARPAGHRQRRSSGPAPTEGELQVKQCGDCSRYHWPPRLGCPYCGSGELAWVAVGPTGEMFSWTVVHRSQTPGFETEVPYAVVLVALDDAKGVRMVGNLVNCSPDELKAGLAVEAVFTPSADGSVKLVNWQPIAGS